MFKYTSIFLLLLLVAVSLQQETLTGAENICFLKPETGPCRAAFKRWAFNATEGKCVQFTYGGCQGNENNFQSQEICLNTCGRPT